MLLPLSNKKKKSATGSKTVSDLFSRVKRFSIRFRNRLNSPIPIGDSGRRLGQCPVSCYVLTPSPRGEHDVYITIHAHTHAHNAFCSSVLSYVYLRTSCARVINNLCLQCGPLWRFVARDKRRKLKSGLVERGVVGFGGGGGDE